MKAFDRSEGTEGQAEAEVHHGGRTSEMIVGVHV